jgi:hypothetical protein
VIERILEYLAIGTKVFSKRAQANKAAVATTPPSPTDTVASPSSLSTTTTAKPKTVTPRKRARRDNSDSDYELPEHDEQIEQDEQDDYMASGFQQRMQQYQVHQQQQHEQQPEQLEQLEQLASHDQQYHEEPQDAELQAGTIEEEELSTGIPHVILQDLDEFDDARYLACSANVSSVPSPCDTDDPDAKRRRLSEPDDGSNQHEISSELLLQQTPYATQPNSSDIIHSPHMQGNDFHTQATFIDATGAVIDYSQQQQQQQQHLKVAALARTMVPVAQYMTQPQHAVTMTSPYPTWQAPMHAHTASVGPFIHPIHRHIYAPQDLNFVPSYEQAQLQSFLHPQVSQFAFAQPSFVQQQQQQQQQQAFATVFAPSDMHVATTVFTGGGGGVSSSTDEQEDPPTS